MAVLKPPVQAWHNIMGGLKVNHHHLTLKMVPADQPVDTPSPHAQTMETPIGDELFGPLRWCGDIGVSDVLPASDALQASDSADTMDGLLDQHLDTADPISIPTRRSS